MPVLFLVAIAALLFLNALQGTRSVPTVHDMAPEKFTEAEGLRMKQVASLLIAALITLGFVALILLL